MSFTKKNHPGSMMLAGPLENSFLEFLIKSHQFNNILELGTYTGYTTLCIAMALAEEGSVTTVDIDKNTVKLAYPFWEKAKVSSKIKSFIKSGQDFFKENKEEFDFIFIDADKVNYLHYLKEGLKALKEGGMIVLDNCLWSGKVLQETNDKSTKAIQEVNEFIKNSKDLYGTLLPVRDGIFLVQKH